MPASKPITIVGGGLAGLTLGIGLRQHGIPATVWEAGRYPRHRVCGEFISGRGQASLARLGLREFLIQAGAIPARTAQFSSLTVAGRARVLPEPALCLPRSRMDPLLAGRFRELGGELHEGERWHETAPLDGVVFASGRQLQPAVAGRRWFGLKAHALGVATAADLEMHASEDGYIGLCRQPGGIVNVCGLFRYKPASGGAVGNWQEQLRGPSGSLLRKRMGGATFVTDSFCSVAGINLKPRFARHHIECRIGDALTMIPPVTGNGMSMAFESAEIAIEPAAAYSRGEWTWTQARQTVARACDASFARRLVWARFLQWLMFSPMLKSAVGSTLLRSDWLWGLIFSRTR